MTPPSSRPLLLGHRGARRYALENTFAAFDLALAHGCDGFEFDVRLTADSRSIICHDPELRRLPIAKTTWHNFASRLPSGALACLDDVVQRYAARCFLDIELKVVGLEQHALELIATHAPKGPHVISSFLPEVLRELRAVNPAARTGFITEKQSTLGKWEALDVAAIIPQHKLVSASLVADVHAAGKQVMVWTVNDAREMRTMADMSVDAIISDDTQLLCRTFGVRAG